MPHPLICRSPIIGLIVISKLDGQTQDILYSGQRKQDSDSKVDAIRDSKSAIPKQIRSDILKTYWTEFVSIRQIAKRYNVSHMSVWRLVNSSARPFV